jgi:hypothetical protein
VYVFVETGNAAWLGVLAALASLPYVLATPFLTVTDRFPRRTVMIAGDAFGVGEGRGAALVLALVGVILVVLGVRLAASPIRHQRRRAEPDESSESDPANNHALPV